MRGWRWPGSAGQLGAGVGVMLLGLSLAQSVPPQTACAAAAAPQSLSQPLYQDTTGKETDVGFMSALVQSFLHTVQPNPFPGDLILKIVNDFEREPSNQELTREALVYQVGFLVCAAIGILYIFMMPIVGFFLACCRCCGNCGGKMYQKQTSCIPCRRRTLYWSAFVTTVIILAGNICMFKSNEALKVSVDHSTMQLNTTIDNIHTFLTAVTQQVDHVVNESYKTIKEVSRNLDDIGRQLGTEIQEPFNKTLSPALHAVRLLNQETRKTSIQLNKLNSSLAQLQSNVDHLQANVTAVKSRISETLSNPNCTGCDNLKPELQKLTLDISITIPGLNELQSTVDEVININLTSKIEELEDYLNSIPQRVINDTKDVVQKSKQLLGDIKAQFPRVTSSIPLSALTNVSGALNRVHGEIGRVAPVVERAEHIRWKVCVALCCVVLLVVVCNVLGLVLGPLGLTPKVDPTKRSCTANCGGTFLMMGAGFSFLFSWLFMIVVVLLFLLGGNVYTLLCRPWNNGQLLKFIDTPGLIPDISQTLGLKTNISFSDIYRDCEENQPLWTTLRLYELINLGDLLNVSTYTEQIRQQFESTDINLSIITLLRPEVKNQLSSFSNKAKNFDFTAIRQQMNNISRINLNGTADELDKLAAIQTNTDTRKELQNEARDLRKIQNSIETTTIPQLENLNSTIKGLQSLTEKIHGTVGEVLNDLGAAQDFLNTNTTQIVKTESSKFVDCQLGYFITYTYWANVTITQQVGRCRPVAGAVDSVEIILCSHMVNSLNTFWFSLGWCMIFFIPSIIFSIKLAKYYRRMKYSDVYDDHIIMNHIPLGQMNVT
ncbi:prominin-2 isoform X1 [Xiphias gladius]|uniref:prominin-2 isoform X1 n=2 Tax=Xiphias gladius TaxID=8245 RepID=UPI001A9879B7|nr:prominin-2 isoform X1 [Xiphias gladius]